MVMAMAGFDGQMASFGYPGATLGAMGAAAQSSAMGASDDQASALRDAELAASYRSAENLGFDELLDPRETRNALAARRQARPLLAAGAGRAVDARRHLPLIVLA